MVDISISFKNIKLKCKTGELTQIYLNFQIKLKRGETAII